MSWQQCVQNKMKYIGLLFLLPIFWANASPLDELRKEEPALYRLIDEYKSYHSQFYKYAMQQNFVQPYESVATVAHEIVHLASATHQGYFIDGMYYEPYVGASNWPSLRNRDIAPLMRQEERGIISSVYMRATPANNLGNILDEINAYTHVLSFVCRHEPTSVGRQVINLIGHLNVVEAYLRVTRTSRPDEYMVLLQNRLSSGAIYTITSRAWSALQNCGVPTTQQPRVEVLHFLSLRK